MRFATSFDDSLPYTTLSGDLKKLNMLSRNSVCGRNADGRRRSRRPSLTKNPTPRCKPMRSAVCIALASGLDRRVAGRNRFSRDARVSQRLEPSLLNVHSEARRFGTTSGMECLMSTTTRFRHIATSLHGPRAVLVVIYAWERQQNQHDDPADQRNQ